MVLLRISLFYFHLYDQPGTSFVWTLNVFISLHTQLKKIFTLNYRFTNGLICIMDFLIGYSTYKTAILFCHANIIESIMYRPMKHFSALPLVLVINIFIVTNFFLWSLLILCRLVKLAIRNTTFLENSWIPDWKCNWSKASRRRFEVGSKEKLKTVLLSGR